MIFRKKFSLCFFDLSVAPIFIFFDLYGRAYFVLPNSGLDSEMFNKQL